MSNEFNLERAQAGEPVEVYETYGKKWIAAHFIGRRRSGEFLAEDMDGTVFYISPERLNSALRMAPKKAKVRYRNYIGKDEYGDFYVGIVNDHDACLPPSALDRAGCVAQWIHTDWQETEITN